MRVLVLGGSTESSELSPLLAADGRFEVVLSLAGRTLNPKKQPVPLRSGGFGGINGLVAWLRENRTEAVIDATHPFAAQMSANVVEACAQLGLPLASIDRPAWQPQPGDHWVSVDSAAEAALAISETPRRVLLTVGRLELSAFTSAPQHRYVARMVDAPGDMALPPDMKVLLARGPFDAASEAALLDDENIEVVVSKNSGGSAAFSKIAAARERGLVVVMIARPHKPRGELMPNPVDAMAWLDRLHQTLSRSARGV